VQRQAEECLWLNTPRQATNKFLLAAIAYYLL
jgi:hypothetical protein